MDLRTFTDEDLDLLRVDVLTEQERRQALVTIPAQIEELTAKYVAGGGNLEDLAQ